MVFRSSVYQDVSSYALCTANRKRAVSIDGSWPFHCGRVVVGYAVCLEKSDERGIVTALIVFRVV